MSTAKKHYAVLDAPGIGLMIVNVGDRISACCERVLRLKERAGYISRTEVCVPDSSPYCRDAACAKKMQGRRLCEFECTFLRADEIYAALWPLSAGVDTSELYMLLLEQISKHSDASMF